MTLQEAKDQIVKKYSHPMWANISRDEMLNEAAELYARNLVLEFSHAIQRDINLKVTELRDHGAHARFCDALNEIRNKVLDNIGFKS